MFRESSQEQGARTPGPGRQDVVKKLLRIRDEGTLETMQAPYFTDKEIGALKGSSLLKVT